MKKKAFVFDLDGTLFETTARDIEGVDGHARYIEFSDVDKLIFESQPLSLVELALEVKKEGHSVYILTARNSIMSAAIRILLEQEGLKPDFVYCVGDRGFEIPSYKAEILEQLSQSYDRTYFFDDDEANLKMVPRKIRAFKA